MSEFERVDDQLLGDFLSPGLHHDDGVGGTGHDQIQVALFGFLVIRVEHQVSVHPPDPRPGDRGVEGDVGQNESRGGAGDGDDVRGIDLVVG